VGRSGRARGLDVSESYIHQVAIQSRAETKDSATGAVSYTWATATTLALDSEWSADALPALVMTGPARGEFMAADAKQAETAARIRLPYVGGLTSDMRILWAGRVFNILALELDLTAAREWRITCSEGVNDGA
jgi:head-tail adaptor